MGLIDVWRDLHPLEIDFTHYSAAHQVHSRIDQFFVNIDDRHRVSECEIGAADVSDHNPVFLKIKLNSRKRQTVWRLNMGMLNNEQRKERVREELQAYIDDNNNGEVDPTVVWDAMKAVMRGKLIVETVLLKKAKLEIYKKNNEKLRTLEQEYQKTKNKIVYKSLTVPP